MVGAADCRSAGPWFNSGWKSWFIFVTGSDNVMNQIIQMFNNKSPIRTVITTITRKSVNMVAELDNDTAPSRILDTSGQRLEDYSTVAKAATAIAVALDTKARAAQGTVVQLKSELVRSQQSRTEAKTRADSLSVITLKPPSELGDDTLVDRIPGRLAGESLDRFGSPVFRLALQIQDQHIRLDDEDQLVTDTADLKMTEDALAEDTAAFEDTMQDCLAIQTKAADFDVHTNKSLSEELEALAKAKVVISEKTGDAEYRDNRSMLSSRGGLATELSKSENSIELAQLASRVDFAIHAETSNGDDPVAKVKGLISDMIKRLEEKAPADANHKAFETKHIFNSMRYMTMSQHKDLFLTISMISFGSYTMKSNLVVYFVSCSWPEVMNIHPCVLANNTISYRETLNPCKTSFDACSLQPTDGASGEYAGVLVIRQETEDTRRTEHMRSRMDLLYQRSLQFLPLDEHFAIRSAVMTTSDCWVILDNRLGMLDVTTKECRGLHRYDCVSLEGDTNSQSSLRRTMTRINFWFHFQADEIYVSRVINQHTVQVKEIVVYLSITENLKLFEDDLEGHQNLLLKKNMLKGVIIVDIEMIAAMSYQSPDYSRWNGWQSIVIEFEYGDDWMDKADGNSQCLETYDTMR